MSALEARRAAVAATSAGLAGKRAAEALRALADLLAVREQELLTLKGPCSNKSCRLHYAHSLPCAPPVQHAGH
jgi:hypothetical protein